MKGYKKPKCDCGKFLYGSRNECWHVTRAITKDGELSKNIARLGGVFDDSDYEINLFCRTCGNIYEADYDDEDRIIRGDLVRRG